MHEPHCQWLEYHSPHYYARHKGIFTTGSPNLDDGGRQSKGG